jgi:hypothetical protein
MYMKRTKARKRNLRTSLTRRGVSRSVADQIRLVRVLAEIVQTGKWSADTKDWIFGRLLRVLQGEDANQLFTGERRQATRTMTRDMAIAMLYECREGGTSAAAESTLATNFGVDIETVRRARRLYGACMRSVLTHGGSDGASAAMLFGVFFMPSDHTDKQRPNR